MAEQRHRAVLAVISDGRTVTEVASAVGVSRQTLHFWLGRGRQDMTTRRALACRALGVQTVPLRYHGKPWIHQARLNSLPDALRLFGTDSWEPFRLVQVGLSK